MRENGDAHLTRANRIRSASREQRKAARDYDKGREEQTLAQALLEPHNRFGQSPLAQHDSSTATESTALSQETLSLQPTVVDEPEAVEFVQPTPNVAVLPARLPELADGHLFPNLVSPYQPRLGEAEEQHSQRQSLTAPARALDAPIDVDTKTVAAAAESRSVDLVVLDANAAARVGTESVSHMPAGIRPVPAPPSAWEETASEADMPTPKSSTAWETTASETELGTPKSTTAWEETASETDLPTPKSTTAWEHTDGQTGASETDLPTPKSTTAWEGTTASETELPTPKSTSEVDSDSDETEAHASRSLVSVAKAIDRIVMNDRALVSKRSAAAKGKAARLMHTDPIGAAPSESWVRQSVHRCVIPCPSHPRRA
jgi:hypothetical protein